MTVMTNSLQYNKREAKRTRRFIILLAFVSLLAPLVYHHQHHRNNDDRDQQQQRRRRQGQQHLNNINDNEQRYHHRISSSYNNNNNNNNNNNIDNDNMQHRTSIAKSYGERDIETDDEDNEEIVENNDNDDDNNNNNQNNNNQNCNKGRGLIVNNKCQCLRLWSGKQCQEGPISIFSSKSKLTEKLSSERKTELPLQFEGDFTTNKEQLRKTCEDGNIKVFLPGKTPPMRVIGTCKSVELAGIPSRDVVSKKPYKSCAVVGNSGMLAYGQNGKEIDSHDVVIRFNGAPTKGLEKRVGTKTTFRLVNSKWLDFRETKDEMILWNMRGAGALEDYIKRRSEKGREEKFYLLSSTFVNYVGEMAYQLSNSFNNLPKGFNAGDYTPTSGWTGLIFAVNVCTEIKLYGMQISEAQGVPYHYHNRCPQPYGERDEAEWLMFQRFVKHNLASFKEPCIEECHTDNPNECKKCMKERYDFYGEEATKEGRIAWEKSPMPHYCLARSMLLEKEKRHMEKGGQSYSKEERDKFLTDINKKIAPPAPQRVPRKRTRPMLP